MALLHVPISPATPKIFTRKMSEEPVELRIDLRMRSVRSSKLDRKALPTSRRRLPMPFEFY